MGSPCAHAQPGPGSASLVVISVCLPGPRPGTPAGQMPPWSAWAVTARSSLSSVGLMGSRGRGAFGHYQTLPLKSAERPGPWLCEGPSWAFPTCLGGSLGTQTEPEGSGPGPMSSVGGGTVGPQPTAPGSSVWPCWGLPRLVLIGQLSSADPPWSSQARLIPRLSLPRLEGPLLLPVVRPPPQRPP